MNRKLVAWGERYLYTPSPLQTLLSFLLLPLSWVYCFGAWLRYKAAVPRRFGVPVVGVGNLTVGGSGKTPLVTALAMRMRRPAVVLRGYGRRSSGLVVVKDAEAIRCDVQTGGDEAMLYAQKLPHAIVIVSERREEAIERAARMGAEAVLLDDAYGKHGIEKLDIVIDVETPSRFCLPAGPYRERFWRGKPVLRVREGKDFFRKTKIEYATQSMALVTAIARPQRLDAYLPAVAAKHYFPDHHYFTESELRSILNDSGAESLLMTYKDYVKVRRFDVPVSLLELELELDDALVGAVKRYMAKEQHANEN